MHRSGNAQAGPAAGEAMAQIRWVREFSGSHAVALLHAAEARGLDTRALMLRAGISESDLAGAVNRSKLTRLTQLICDELQDEFFGLTRRPCKPGSFALMCKLMLA